MIKMDDPITPTAQGGITKLEHFAIMIMQTRLTVKDAFNESSPKGELKLIAQQSIRDASIFIESLNEHYARIEQSKQQNKRYAVNLNDAIPTILGLDEKDVVLEKEIHNGPLPGPTSTVTK